VKILVAVKPAPNPDEKVKIKWDGSGIVLDNIKMVVNPFCEIAAEIKKLKSASWFYIYTKLRRASGFSRSCRQ
jgi:Electron transfer flavoprotein, beta subunit